MAPQQSVSSVRRDLSMNLIHNRRFCDASQGCQSNCGYLNAHGNLSTLVNSPQLDNGSEFHINYNATYMSSLKRLRSPVKPASRALGGAFDTGQICTVSGQHGTLLSRSRSDTCFNQIATQAIAASLGIPR